MSKMHFLLPFICIFIVSTATASRIVNISDAWLLSDAESPVFYRHFRDRVTWSEAEAICQFHHSVLATVRNTGEFDRTRALLQELDWVSPVWVGLRRVLGQPMFKWSTPAGATLLPSDGYWHETPNTQSSRALCVTVDPAADFRWKAVDCASSTELFSFLCQIPVPSWARSEHGGCLSPRWPSNEVTVQYLPQTRALEMIADCGLKGTKRIACKQHSTVDIEHMERKLQCPSDVTSSVSGSATPPRPPTRHRRDTNPSTASTPEAETTPTTPVSHEIAPSHAQPATPPPLAETSSTSVPKVSTTIAPAIKVTDKVSFMSVSDVKTTTNLPAVTETITQHFSSEQENVTEQEVSTVTQNTMEESTLMITDTSTPEATTTEFSVPVSEPTTTTEAILITTTLKHPTYLYRSSTVQPSVTSSHDEIITTNVPVPRVNSLTPIQNMQPMAHQVAPGVPRNIATLTHVNNHPPMMIGVTHTAGVPRNIPSLHAHTPPLVHPILMAEGAPRTANAEEIQHTAEETPRRRQLLPATLRGMVPVTSHSTEEQTTVDSLNSQTEEEMMEAAQRRQHSRRSSRPQQFSSARNLYPYLINRMLG